MKRLIRAYIIIIICLLAGSATASVSPQHFTKDEILFISSYNSDTKYTYSSISQFVDEYIKLGGKYSPVVESMNCTTLENQAEWIDNMDLILEKHPHAKLIIPSRIGSMDKLLFADRREIQGIARLLPDDATIRRYPEHSPDYYRIPRKHRRQKPSGHVAIHERIQCQAMLLL